MPISFRQAGGAPVDLDGSTVHFVAQALPAVSGAAAVLDLSQSSHADAAAGRTSLPIDLSGLPDEVRERGATWFAELWLEDAAGQRIPYGGVHLMIEPSAKSWPPDEE
jgi:hypothetical protein